MTLLLGILLLLVRNTTQDCIIDHRGIDTVWEQQIKKDVLEPVANEPQCNTSAPFEVSLRFTLKYFELNSEQSTFSVHTWAHMTWTHERFSWEPSRYGGVQETVLTSGVDMWYPTFRVLNSPEVDDVAHSYYVPCSVHHTGRVSCVPAFNDAVLCTPDYSAWPYDRQACSVIIAAPQYGYGLVKNIQFKFGGRAITMIGAEYGAEWMIVEYEQQRNESAHTLNMTFVLERYGEGMGAIVVRPAALLTVVSVSALALDARRHTRPLLLAAGAACLVRHGQAVRLLSPAGGGARVMSPRIVRYYGGALLVSVLALLCSLLVRRVYSCAGVMPAPLARLCDYVSAHGAWLCAPRPEPGAAGAGSWPVLAHLLHVLCLLVFSLVYLVMYLCLVPQPYGISD